MKRLEDFVWDGLPFTKHAIGRRRINTMTWMAGDLLPRGIPAEQIAGQMCNAQRYGMGVVAMLVLSAIANHIVRLVIEWFRRQQAEQR